ncbi:hypothetical protein P7F60_12165 [Rhizobium sp. YJ-22]|uniref:hypothetical protein n=1 Tax=Rhizobium sp. YJ-22 TaxID=3037556 RepID=UPI002412A9A4|nr:hypothetical protein [Rhizobium sp. YJ-22]MDG3577147.1 hypothetical protein [Rhizobium sp. YJ-22]
MIKSEDDAWAFYEFFQARVHGWDSFLSVSPKTGFIDYRTKKARAAGALFRDLHLNAPDRAEIFDTLFRGRDPILLWPREFHDVLRFRLWHLVPEEKHEPLSPMGMETRTKYQEMPPWPDFLLPYAEMASADDHPPFPPKSELYLCMERAHAHRGQL